MRGLLALVLLLGWSPPSGAAGLFEENDIIEIRLTGPLNALFRDTEQREEQPFLLNVEGVDIPVKVRVRGKSRARLCDFPPLRLNFAGGEALQTVFAGQQTLKLVTHCRNDKGRSENTLEEYAAYRIFNLLSDYSYRVRLLHISYDDTGLERDTDALPQYGFIIEPKQHLPARTGGEWARIPGVKMSWIDDSQAALVFVFQYLIGNTDWSLVPAEGEDACCHNGDLLKIDTGLYLVPYDFDLSGLVSANYAKPDASLRLKNVRQRLYRGYCIDKDALAGAIHIVNSKQAEILGVLKQLPGYTDKMAAKSGAYLERFFELAENENKLLKSFEKKCLD